MTEEEAARELELVRLAIQLGSRFGGCCEWDARAAQRIGESPPCEGLTAKGIKDLLLQRVGENDSGVRQVAERRAEYSERPYYYKVIVPVPEFPRGLFVELILVDDDPHCPTVVIVNAREQRD